jgi:hypothetical protein
LLVNQKTVESEGGAKNDNDASHHYYGLANNRGHLPKLHVAINRKCKVNSFS